MTQMLNSTWLATFVVACIAAPAGFAQNSLIIDNVPGYPGATVSVPVSLQQSAGGGVAVQFDVSFDPAKVVAGNPVATLRLANHIVRSREIAPGVRRTLVYSPGNTAIAGTNGAILNLPFTVSPQERIGSGPLSPSRVVVATPEGNPLTPLSLDGGNVFVRPVNLLPDGHVQFFLPSTNGQRYAIQATTNLVEWVNLSTNVATGAFMDLIDIDAAGSPYRFYRRELLP